MHKVLSYFLKAIFRGTFNQQASLTLIVLALERYWATVHPLTFEGFCSKQVSLYLRHTFLSYQIVCKISFSLWVDLTKNMSNELYLI